MFRHLFIFKAFDAAEISSLSSLLESAPDGEFKFAGAFTRLRVKIDTVLQAKGADR